MIINPSDRIGEVKEYYFSRKLAQIAEMSASGDPVLNLGIGSPDLLPPRAVMDALSRAIWEPDANKYQSYRSIPELRRAFASHYDRFMDVTLDPEKEILPLIGSKEGIMHISMSFLSAGDQVLVPNPGYPSYSVTAELAGATPIFYDLKEENGWLPDLELLESLDLSRVKIMWINYPNMPTGAGADLSFFRSLVSFAMRHKILICHDNPYNFILNDTPLSIFNVAEAKECALELCSLSKCFNMAGWRVGALIGGKDYVDLVLRFKSNMDSGMYKAVQKAAVVALDQGQQWFDELNEIYRKRRDKVWEIYDLLDCHYSKDSVGMFVWARVPDYISDVEAWIEDILIRTRVFITPGFIFGTNGDRYIRVALCSSEEIFKTAFNKIDQLFVKSLA